MSEETKFLIEISPVIIQIFMLFIFYAAALRRLFIPPTPSNVLVLVLVFIGIPGLLFVFLWGWVRHKRMCMTQLMAAWTWAILVFACELIFLANFEQTVPMWVTMNVLLLGVATHSLLAFRTLVPFLRADERMRALMRESNPKRIQQLAQLGEQAIPNVRFMLEHDYAEYRILAVECLAAMGAKGMPLLKSVASNGDAQEAAAARAILDDVEPK